MDTTRHSTASMGSGKVTKVKTMRTSKEVRVARMRERQAKRLHIRRMAMLEAVERAVALPEPLPRGMSHEEKIEMEPTAARPHDAQQPKRWTVDSMLGSISTLINKMQTLVLEEG